MPEVAAIVAPVTPVVTDMNSAFDAIRADTLAAQAAESGEVVTPRNEKGQFVAVSASGDTNAIPPAQLPDDAPVIEGAPAATETPAETFEVPDGYSLPAVLPDDKARGFKVSDAEGEILAPDLTWELTANGKPRTLSTDKLVAYAQMGVYNHEREQLVEQTQARATQLERHANELQSAVQLRDQQIEHLLSDPDYLYRAQAAFAAQNTPEAQAERQRQQLEAQRQEFQLQQDQYATRQFLDGPMAGALEMLHTQFPTVTQDELAAKLFMAADPYRRNGVLMPQGHEPLKQWVVRELMPQVQQLHEQRLSERTAPQKAAAAVTDQAKIDVQKAQVTAQKARAVATRALKSSAGRVMAESKPAPVVRSLKDAESVIFDQTKAAMAQTG